MNNSTAEGFEEHNIQVVKTARYYSYGNKNAKQIWYLLHGYGMPAFSMLKAVKSLNKEDILFIAPEGLSRFYRSGYSGAIVASWMTKEDRLNEIKDYVLYLENLNEKVNPTNLTINVLGFSQGVATASRWVVNSKASFNNIILWAGEPAMEIDYAQSKEKFANSKFIFGNNDPFITDTNINSIKHFFNAAGIPILFRSFEGKHELDSTLLSQLL